MNKFLKSMIVGVAAGAAAVYLHTTEKGKELKKKSQKAYDDYKENPEEYHQKAKEKASEYSNLAIDTFNDYKDKFDSGEITKEDIFSAVKEKGEAAAEFASEKVSEVTEKFAEVFEKDDEVNSDDVNAEVDDIVIDYQESDDTDEESVEIETSDEDESEEKNTKE